MNNVLDFIQKIIKDLHLGAIRPNIQKALELRINEMVDDQIEMALSSSLTAADWKIYDHYRTTHPEAPEQEAFSKMVESRPELQEALSGALFSTYKDVMIRRDAMLEAEGEAGMVGPKMVESHEG